MKFFSPPLIVFITGHPATGKTTIGKRLAKEIELPFLCRDDIKETLYDCLGWSDREWSKMLGYASYELLYQFMELQLSGGYSFVVETNFNPEYANPRIITLKKRYPFESLQIHCEADSEILIERYKSRGRVGGRHPGHIDLQGVNELRERLQTNSMLHIGCETIIVNTNDFSMIEQEKLLEEVNKFILISFNR
ncbi:MAG: AAA family ATPase [Promethearchaeota archaeon]